MTQAAIRECSLCKTQLVKENGCNRVTCRCGNTICYVCRESKIQYDHFCQHAGPHGKGGCKICKKTCFLWTDTHADEVKKIRDLKKKANEERLLNGYNDEKDVGAPADEADARLQRRARGNDRIGRRDNRNYQWPHGGFHMNFAPINMNYNQFLPFHGNPPPPPPLPPQPFPPGHHAEQLPLPPAAPLLPQQPEPLPLAQPADHVRICERQIARLGEVLRRQNDNYAVAVPPPMLPAPRVPRVRRRPVIRPAEQQQPVNDQWDGWLNMLDGNYRVVQAAQTPQQRTVPPKTIQKAATHSAATQKAVTQNVATQKAATHKAPPHKAATQNVPSLKVTIPKVAIMKLNTVTNERSVISDKAPEVKLPKSKRQKIPGSSSSTKRQSSAFQPAKDLPMSEASVNPNLEEVLKLTTHINPLTHITHLKRSKISDGKRTLPEVYEPSDKCVESTSKPRSQNEYPIEKRRRTSSTMVALGDVGPKNCDSHEVDTKDSNLSRNSPVDTLLTTDSSMHRPTSELTDHIGQSSGKLVDPQPTTSGVDCISKKGKNRVKTYTDGAMTESISEILLQSMLYQTSVKVDSKVLQQMQLELDQDKYRLSCRLEMERQTMIENFKAYKEQLESNFDERKREIERLREKLVHGE